MSMLWDWHHVIKLQLPHLDLPVEVIPTTRTSDMVIMHKECSSCWTMDGAHWIPSSKLPVGTDTENSILPEKHDLYFEYFFMQSIEDRKLSGHYWEQTGFCFEGQQCEQDGEDENEVVSEDKNKLVVFAVEDSSPSNFSTLGDGYMGLGTGEGYDGTTKSNLLE